MKLEKLKLNQLLSIFSIALLIFLLVPIIFLIYYFKDQSISSLIGNWGSFGSFVGGVMGSIIALANLVVLIVITIQVNKLNSEENKNLFLFKKRIEAYDELSKFALQLNLIPSELLKIVEYFNEKISEKQQLIDNQFVVDSSKQLENVLKLKMKCDKELNNFRQIFDNYYFFMSTFNLRFGHLFTYDFNSDEYKSALEILSKIRLSFGNLSSYENAKNINFKEFHSDYSKMNELLLPLFNKLRNEVK